MNRLSPILFRQLGRPSGVLGWLLGRHFARHNVYEAQWTVDLLDLQPADEVLEVGVGPGLGIEEAAARLTTGHVAGLDHSPVMVRMAQRRNAAAIRTGRVQLRVGTVTALPYADGAFDKAFSIHCVYFWPAPVAAFREIRRVLRPGGWLAITVMPSNRLPGKGRTPPPPDLFRPVAGDELARMMAEAGFGSLRVEACSETEQFPGLAVLGRAD